MSGGKMKKNQKDGRTDGRQQTRRNEHRPLSVRCEFNPRPEDKRRMFHRQERWIWAADICQVIRLGQSPKKYAMGSILVCVRTVALWRYLGPSPLPRKIDADPSKLPNIGENAPFPQSRIRGTKKTAGKFRE